MIEMPELFLRRPISVCDSHEGLLTLVYKVVGEGTQKMAEMTEGTTLNIITGLGNGYRSPSPSLPEGRENEPQQVLLVGGGVGVPPLFYQARVLRAQGVHVTVVLGFNAINEVFAVEDFKRLGCEVTVLHKVHALHKEHGTLPSLLWFHYVLRCRLLRIHFL